MGTQMFKLTEETIKESLNSVIKGALLHRHRKENDVEGRVIWRMSHKRFASNADLRHRRNLDPM